MLRSAPAPGQVVVVAAVHRCDSRARGSAQRGELLAELIVQVARDPRALVLLGRDELAQQETCAAARRLARVTSAELVGPLATRLSSSIARGERLRRLLLRRQSRGRSSQSPSRASPRRSSRRCSRTACRPCGRATARRRPALVARASRARRAGIRPRGPRREQDLEVLADDLVGAVAEHPLGAGVPRVDAAVVRHREDRVVDGAVDEQAQASSLARDLALSARGGR